MASLPLITPAEADATLIIGVFPEWNAITNDQKEYYIQQASDYMRKNWSCTADDFFGNPPIVSDDSKRACAYYAESARAGNLYSSPSDSSSTSGAGALTRLTLKAGSLEKTEEFSEGVTAGGPENANGYADDIMCAQGCSALNSAGTKSLSRN